MRTRTFSEEEKDQIRKQMIEAGLPLLKEHGMLHMSITKLTAAAGIGKSTFYNFYASKEEFVEDMLKYHRRKIMEQMKSGRRGEEKYSKQEAKNLLHKLIIEANNLYANFSMEDEIALKNLHEKNGTQYLNLEHEKNIIQSITSHMEGVKADLDYAVISNLMKIIVFTSEQRALLHPEGYETSMDMLFHLLLDNIFEDEEKLV